MVPMTGSASPAQSPRAAEPLVLLGIAGIATAVSAHGAHDRLTWWLEAAPVFIAAAVMLATWRRFPLTPLLYRLALMHALVLLLGAHYTYAFVPAGLWAQELLDLMRNPYDRLGHLMQGFVPAIAVREILLRCSPLRPGAWLQLTVTALCLAISAFYELAEWWAAILWGGSAEAFLGTQGDVWDTQWDMFLALCGALAAQALLARLHDRQLARLAHAP